MRRENKGRRGRSGGYMLITILLFFLVATTAVIAGISSAVFREVRTIRNEALSKQSYFTSESAVEDVAYRMKTGKSTASIAQLSIAGTVADISVSTAADGSTVVTSDGDAGGTKRTTELVLSQTTGIVFENAAYSGLGGIDLLDGVDISGDIYTLGSIRGCGSCSIAGEAVAAGKSEIDLDQENATPALPPNSIGFANVNSSQDLAQSFVVSEAKSLINVELYIRKTGNPANATVRITTDNGGKPSSTVLASGSLLSSTLSTSYEWKTITLTANPILSTGTTYWIVVDANSNPSNNYAVGANATYSGGQAKVGRYNNGSWNNTSLDSYFRVNIGTNEDGITGEDQWNRLSVGSAYSYEASYVDSSGDLFCQTGTQNNKACDTSRGDPALEESPVPDEAIAGWKDEAAASVHSGNYTVGWAGATVGPKKIEGDLSVGSGGTLRVSGSIHVTGNVTINGGAVVLPDDSTKSYVIVADGTVTLTGGAEILGGDPGSYILIISTSTADPAITLNGGANDTIVYVPYGGVLATGGAVLNALGAEHVTIGGGADLVYDPNITLLNLTSGSSGGEFSIKSWKETE